MANRKKRRRAIQKKIARVNAHKSSGHLNLDFDDAHKLHQQGQLEEAKAVYMALLERNVRQGNVWHQLGMAHHQSGQLQEAVECMSNAQSLIDPSPEFFSDFGVILLESSQVKAANDYFVAALKLMAENFSANHKRDADLAKQQKPIPSEKQDCIAT